MLNFYRDMWFESNNIMGEVLEMYYNMIMMYLICIFFVLVLFLYFYFSSLWTSNIVAEYIMELIFFLLPVFLLSLFLIFSMKALYMSEKMFGQMNTFKITGNQWFWTIEYKDNLSFDCYVMSSLYNYDYFNLEINNHIYIPLNIPNIMLITSQDVIHSVGFPDGGLKVDAIPGRLNSLEMLSFSTGALNGFCTELCGPLHAFMPFCIEFII
uniref:Cytochrome c oxidase subunit 2 n=1 Tax=Elaphrothrips spiniceps TaxID=3003602 RepID=A0AA50LTY8_9NEOP|nr:cytochrome c oxidase subunit II [Elaphrothrips spiniceps]